MLISIKEFVIFLRKMSSFFMAYALVLVMSYIHPMCLKFTSVILKIQDVLK